MSPVLVLLGLLAAGTGALALARPEYVFRRENVLFAGDDDLTDRERVLVRRGAGGLTLALGLVLLALGVL